MDSANGKRKIVRVSSKKGHNENDDQDNNDGDCAGTSEPKCPEVAEVEEEIIDPFTRKRRESLKNDVFDIYGKVRTLQTRQEFLIYIEFEISWGNLCLNLFTKV